MFCCVLTVEKTTAAIIYKHASNGLDKVA